MNIRYAETRDIPEIGEILLQVNEVHHVARPDLFKTHSRKYSDAELEAIISDPGRFILVAEENGKIMGYAFCILENHAGSSNFMPIKTLYLDDLCVDEGCRGHHIGTMLYIAVLELAESLGCYNVTLAVWRGNDSARQFYDAMGLDEQKTVLETIL